MALIKVSNSIGYEHHIEFSFEDVAEMVELRPEDIEIFFVPECSDRDCLGKTCRHPNENRHICLTCDAPHFFEAYLDGWPVVPGMYAAKLHTGITVPVAKEVFDAWLAKDDQHNQKEYDCCFRINGCEPEVILKI